MKEKTFYKLIILMLVIALTAASLSMLASCKVAENEGSHVRTQEEKETTFSIGIIADPQVLAAEYISDTSKNNTYYYHYTKESNSMGKMLDISEAIYRTAIDDIAKQNVDVVFLIGDLTDTGGRASELMVLEGCEKLKAAGKQVFVANGICDTATDQFWTYLGNDYTNKDTLVANCSILPAAFKELFADFGYNQAVFQDDNSISYAADIPNTNYRVLMLENTKDYNGNTVGLSDDESNPMCDAQFNWIETVLKDSQRSGKEVFVISSLPIEKNPIPYYTTFVSDTYLTMDRGAELQKLFLTYGVNYVFSGHTHIDAENQIYDYAGNTLYEITTTSLNIYPSAYNIVEIKDDFTYLRTSKKLEKLNADYLPDYISEETKNAVITDYAAYAKARCKNDFIEYRNLSVLHRAADVRLGEEGIELILNFLTSLEMYPAYEKDKDGLNTNVIDEEKTALFEQISQDIIGWMFSVNEQKLYGSGNTIESVLNPYNISMPQSAYTDATVMDYIMDVIFRMWEGSFTQTETDVALLTNIFYAGVKEFADLNVFERLNALDGDVRPCDINIIADGLITSDIINLKADDFLLTIISLFYPYLREEKPLLYNLMKSINNTDALLESFGLMMPIIATGITDIYYFTNENGELETNFISLSKGEIYCKPFIAEILFPVIIRTAIIL